MLLRNQLATPISAKAKRNPPPGASQAALPPTDLALGGPLSGVTGFAQGGIYLLAGPPGSRKSGLALQVALDRGATGKRSLLLLSEEWPSRVTERALRMLIG